MKEIMLIDFAKILADETRQKIMMLCCCQWISVNDIVQQLNVKQPTVSHHLAVLRRFGLVNVHEEGRNVFYILNQEKIISCCGHLIFRFAPDTDLAASFQEIEEENTRNHC